MVWEGLKAFKNYMIISRKMRWLYFELHKKFMYDIDKTDMEINAKDRTPHIDVFNSCSGKIINGSCTTKYKHVKVAYL